MVTEGGAGAAAVVVDMAQRAYGALMARREYGNGLDAAQSNH